MYVTIDIYCAATGVCADTAGRRLAGTPYRCPPRERGRKFFPLAGAVMTLKRREIEAGAIADLVKNAVRLDDDFYIEPDALPLAREFADWLPADARDRLRAAQNGFTVAVANSRLCTPSIVQNLGPLRELFALCPPVLAWVLNGDTPPDVDHIAPAFAVSNNSPALGLNHTNMEAA